MLATSKASIPVIMSNQEPAKCPRCLHAFDCKADAIQQCHCSAVQLSPYQRQYVAQNWKDCLCAKCLTEIKQTVPKNTDS